MTDFLSANGNDNLSEIICGYTQYINIDQYI